jgi:hypothetical protein
MRRSERDALRARYQFRCGYCGTTEVDAGGELTVDHFRPRSREGADTPENWVYACITCNDHKADFWQSDLTDRILHPLHDDLAEQIREGDDGQLVALTETGRFHVKRLQLNRPQLILQRQRNRQLLSLHERMRQLQDENAALLRQIQAIEEQVRLIMEESERELEP